MDEADYGYSQQGLSWLIEKRKKWYQNIPRRTRSRSATASRCSPTSNGGGIGVVKEISGDDVYYTLFSPNVIYRKKLKDIVWNERNWRWETTGLGMMRKLALGGDRCRS